MGKVENAGIFSFLHSVFKSYSFRLLTLYSIDQQQIAFENIVGKGENARNEQFLLFPQCFLLSQVIVSQFVHIFGVIFLFAAELEEPEIGISGKGLNLQIAW